MYKIMVLNYIILNAPAQLSILRLCDLTTEYQDMWLFRERTAWVHAAHDLKYYWVPYSIHINMLNG